MLRNLLEALFGAVSVGVIVWVLAGGQNLALWNGISPISGNESVVAMAAVAAVVTFWVILTGWHPH